MREVVLVSDRLLEGIEFLGCELDGQPIGYRNQFLLSPALK